MKIAAPVHDDTLRVFANAGHAPFFAVFDISGNGKFRAAKLVDLRANPRVNLEAEDGCEHENNPQDEPLEESCYESKREELRVMTAILSDCAELVTAKACKNARRAFSEAGVKVNALGGGYSNAKEMIDAFMSASHSRA
jgi:predicted Fe-Mo cluster-binding NifX family protein